MTDKLVKVMDTHGVRTGGVCSFVTWERLIAAGCFQDVCRTGEKIVQVNVTIDGIKFYIENNHEHIGPDRDHL